MKGLASVGMDFHVLKMAKFACLEPVCAALPRAAMANQQGLSAMTLTVYANVLPMLTLVLTHQTDALTVSASAAWGTPVPTGNFV